MSERYIPPPPPYELSLQRDQKISEELQELELSKKSPVHDDEENPEWEDNKDSKALAQKVLMMQTSVQPLHIQKRSVPSNNAGLRGPRPLPPSPADARLRQAPGGARRFSPIPENKERAAELDRSEEPYSPAPPPFSAVAPSLDRPAYERSFFHPSTSAAPSPLNSPLRPSFDTPRNWQSNQRPYSSYSPTESRPEPSYRRASNSSFQTAPSHTPSPSRNYGMRLAFNPSVAYSNSQNDPWGTVVEPRQPSAAALYSSAISSHLHPGSAMNPGSRQSYM
ncbi:hypothetical protein HYDPIDRAFT_105280 [Hydnomerulius pinastri MD-312]|nr:hypothetical protein HYDPIDRAFT_105280 [Hydnomerulius pinastri MD-312]